ncbi:MAG: type II secretion system F family protein [Myxococcales bacterium]|nr:type II secretion system F family protein [Polyangiaceae bacterium]MDW8251055.1 type II secretion system F family protein [Myxococcales bacterium]
MGKDITSDLLKWGGLGLITVALFLIGWSIVADPQSLLWRQWARYVAHIERQLRLMFIFTPGIRVAQGQVGGVFAILILHALVDIPFWWAFVLAVIFLPPLYIEQMKEKRVLAIEAQVDGFLMALSNALKATPSVADAFISIQPLIPPPLQQEIELAIKEMRLGSSLDQSLLHMAGRVGSRQFDTALSAVLIGRQLGGNLPQILDTTASTFREMARLEGFVRSKTAEGKAQLFVLAVFPFGMVYALNALQPGYFNELSSGIIGYIVAILAGIFWIASLLVARKVLNVDI